MILPFIAKALPKIFLKCNSSPLATICTIFFSFFSPLKSPQLSTYLLWYTHVVVSPQQATKHYPATDSPLPRFCPPRWGGEENEKSKSAKTLGLR